MLGPVETGILHPIADFALSRTREPLWVTGAAGAVALAVVADHRLWRFFRFVVTIAHEGGHAGVALLSRRTVHHVRLHADTSGLTVTSGRPTGPGMIATAAAGYLSPSVLGLLAAAGLAGGYVSPVLIGFAVLLLGLLVAVRTVFGVLTVVGCAAALIGLAGWTPAPVQGAAAVLLCWFLLLAGPRPVLELQHQRRRGQAPRSDADQLAALSHLPAILWVGFFLVFTVVAALAGAALLLRPWWHDLPFA